MLQEDFKALGMEDESILMEVNLEYLERAIKEFKLKTKEVKKQVILIEIKINLLFIKS